MENSIINETNAGIYKSSTLEKIKTYKNILLKATIWMLVGGVACGAFCIVFMGATGSDVIAKFMGTLFILAAASLVSFVNFNKIETKIPSVQVFATIGVVMNVFWMILWTLALWGVFDIWARGVCDTGGYFREVYCPIIGYSVFGFITLISSYLSGLGFFGALTLGIYEGTKRATIRPLKITAIICLVYVELHAIVRLFTEYSHSGSSYSTSSFDGRFDMLAGFAGFVWLIVAFVAHIMGKGERNAIEYAEKKAKDEAQQKILEQAAASINATQATPATPTNIPKTDDELRAEIEEKVRREMIEKEVREKVEKEMAAKKND